VLSLRAARAYEATAKFMPQGKSQNSASAVAGIAAQLGISVSAGQPGETPEFYVDLLTSRAILSDLVATRFTFPTDSGVQASTPLALFGGEATDPAAQRENAIASMEERIDATTAATGVVTLRVASPNAALSAQMAAKLLELLNRFNLEQRQSQAAAERRFAEQRLGETRATLRAAEARLQAFLQQNRVSDAPALRFEGERLAREVALQQGLYTTLAQAHEQAKLQEVRDIPVLTVIERPEVPVRPKGRGTVKKTVIALVVGLAFGVFIAFLREFLSPSGGASEELAEFAALKRATVADIKRPWRPVARAFGRGRAAAG
jgi:uncharacterized protein involved in exopolysaccharide biosynthesis